jgi:hypothetical protein
VAFALIGARASAQEVRTFIDPAKANSPPAFNSDADREYLKTMVRAFGGAVDASGDVGSCQWRSPLKTPGGYADAAPGGEFYARIPFPRSALKVQNVKMLDRPELAQVAYLELRGKRDFDRDSISWEFVDVVFPPAAQPTGGAPPQFTVAVGKAGSYRLSQLSVQPLVPRQPMRVGISDYMPDILAGLKEGGTMEVTLTRLTGSTIPRLSVSADFSMLAQDIAGIAAQLRRQAPNQCIVFNRDCFDGRCG